MRQSPWGSYESMPSKLALKTGAITAITLFTAATAPNIRFFDIGLACLT